MQILQAPGISHERTNYVVTKKIFTSIGAILIKGLFPNRNLNEEKIIYI
jgi:hypothetical protein